jgi:tRNA G18 (ribose-2'-O)-methylase SpoU
VLGSEGPGLTREAMEACETRVSIRMAPGTDSLNVATALAVALHELLT